MAKVDSNVEVTIKRARLSFEHIFKAQAPKADKDGKVGASTFNCAFLISKKDGKMLDEIEDAIAECKKKMWGDKPPKIREDRTPYRDGEDYEYEGYPGNMVISARNQRAPQVVHSKKDEDGKFIKLDGSEGVIYSGCYVNGIVRFWAQDSQEYGKRINCSLEVVQFYGDGEAFSGASKVDADDRLTGLEGEVQDEDPRTEGRSRSSRESRPRDDDRSDRGRDRDEDRPARGRDRDEEPRGGRDREKDDGRDTGRRDRSSSSREAETDDRSSRRERGRDDDDGRDSRGSRDRDEGRGESRSRSSRDDGDRVDSRSRDSSRDRDERDADRGSSRRGSERDERPRDDDRDRGRDRERSSSRGEDDDRPRSRSRRESDDLI